VPAAVSRHTTVRVCVPPPHVAEHVPQSEKPHEYVVHASVLHDWRVAGMAPADAVHWLDATVDVAPFCVR